MVTIFTPIYNRAYIVEQLYQSLLNQTNYNFEWLIIDDGSDDQIGELVNGWKNKRNAPFTIRFYRQENGGKHRAINKGVQLAEGDAFFIVDSDDYLTEDAVELIYKWWEDVKEDESYAGISGLRGYKNEQVIGDMPLFKTYIDASNMDRKQYGLLGDKAEIYKTSVLRKYPFPEIAGENFLTESVVWDRIAYDGLKIRWYNRIIYICEYREDGLTNQGGTLFTENPIGWGIHIQQTCHFYNLTSEERFNQYFNYYLILRDKMTQCKIQTNLNIDDMQLTEIISYHSRCIEKTINNIGKRIAVYGGGMRGKRVLNLYRNTEVEVCYVIDRKAVDMPCRQIALTEHFPVVDAIIITPKEEQDMIAEFLESKTINRLLKYDDWKLCVGLNQGI